MNEREQVKAGVTRSYKELRDRTDPRGHMLLDGLMDAHLETLDYVFNTQALASAMVKARAEGLRLIEGGAA